jgi:hypothetical protein
MITYKQLLVLLEDYKSDWLEKQRKQGNVTPENEQEHKTWLEHFHKNKNLLAPEHKELHRHRNLQSIKDAFGQVSDKSLSASLQQRHETATPEQRAGAETIHQSPGLTVQHIKSENASCHYGKGTKWCVSANKANQFNNYNALGNFHIIHGKDEEGKPHRYGVHFEQNEAQNEQNTNIGLKGILKNNPGLKNVDAFQFKHPDFTSDENQERLANLNFEDAEKIVSNKKEHPNLRENMIQTYPYGVSPETMKKIALDKTEHPDVRSASINSKIDKLTPDEVDKIMSDKTEHPRVRNTVMKSHPNDVKQKHIDQILNDEDSEHKEPAILKAHAFNSFSDLVRQDHVRHTLNGKNEDPGVKILALRHGKQSLSKDEIGAYVDEFLMDPHEHQNVKQEILNNFKEHIKSRHIHHMLTNPHEHHDVVSKILGDYDHMNRIDPNKVKEIIDSKFDNKKEHPDVRTAALNAKINNTDYDEKEGSKKILNDPTEDPKIKLHVLRYHKHGLNDIEVMHHLIPMSKSKDDDVRMLADNTLSVLAQGDDKDVLHHLALHGSDYVKREVASNIATHPDTLQHLAEKSDDYMVHRTIAGHRNAHPDTLHHLAKKSNNPDVHLKIADHPYVLPDTLQHLAEKSNNPDVHARIAEHPYAHPDTLHHLAKKSNNPDVHKMIAGNPNAHPDTLQHLAEKSNNPDVHARIAEHPNVLPDTLQHLAEKSNNPDVHARIAEHPNAHPDTLHHLAKKSNNPDVHLKIADHPNVLPDTLHEIGVKSPHVAVHKKIADHPNVLPDTLHHLAENSDDNMVHRRIAIHPNAHPDTLHHLAKKSNNPDVHLKIADHPNVLPETKKYIADNNLL